MNSERWEQITASFALNGKPLSSLVNSAKGDGTLSKGKNGNTIDSGRSSIKCSSNTTANHREGPVLIEEPSSCFNHNEDLDASEKEIQEHGNLEETDDVQGKLIENLYKILKDKSEKIKVQEQVIQALNGRLQGSVRDVSKSHKENKGISADDEESKGLKLYNPHNEDTLEGMPMLKQIAIKVDHVEKRLDTIINCLQRKFPKTFIEIEEGRERQRESVIFPKPWEKSPALYPKPTNGSLMREMHCRRRCNNKSESLEEKFSRRNLTVFQQQRPMFSSFPVITNEDDIEQRMQALERLVVLLKRKIMTRINSKKKQRKV